ncbi:hypothetical protein BJ875DRAFT_538960 [Amylocarpus encephaloides]|uniref:Uncharacterized protein n=1 Tax=Amylocarpus encephaloides TaxID=45428 RepID=A0A9P7YT23_9HELO|nr:hypothetical protein BJ875DRAFT_538960 [Amylocarpus encephaloides]
MTRPCQAEVIGYTIKAVFTSILMLYLMDLFYHRQLWGAYIYWRKYVLALRNSSTLAEACGARLRTNYNWQFYQLANASEWWQRMGCEGDRDGGSAKVWLQNMWHLFASPWQQSAEIFTRATWATLHTTWYGLVTAAYSLRAYSHFGTIFWMLLSKTLFETVVRGRNKVKDYFDNLQLITDLDLLLSSLVRKLVSFDAVLRVYYTRWAAGKPMKIVVEDSFSPSVLQQALDKMKSSKWWEKLAIWFCTKDMLRGKFLPTEFWVLVMFGTSFVLLNWLYYILSGLLGGFAFASRTLWHQAVYIMAPAVNFFREMKTLLSYAGQIPAAAISPFLNTISDVPIRGYATLVADQYRRLLGHEGRSLFRYLGHFSSYFMSTFWLMLWMPLVYDEGSLPWVFVFTPCSLAIAWLSFLSVQGSEEKPTTPPQHRKSMRRIARSIILPSLAIWATRSLFYWKILSSKSLGLFSYQNANPIIDLIDNISTIRAFCYYMEFVFLLSSQRGWHWLDRSYQQIWNLRIKPAKWYEDNVSIPNRKQARGFSCGAEDNLPGSVENFDGPEEPSAGEHQAQEVNKDSGVDTDIDAHDNDELSDVIEYSKSEETNSQADGLSDVNDWLDVKSERGMRPKSSPKKNTTTTKTLSPAIAFTILASKLPRASCWELEVQDVDAVLATTYLKYAVSLAGVVLVVTFCSTLINIRALILITWASWKHHRSSWTVVYCNVREVIWPQGSFLLGTGCLHRKGCLCLDSENLVEENKTLRVEVARYEARNSTNENGTSRSHDMRTAPRAEPGHPMAMNNIPEGAINPPLRQSRAINRPRACLTCSQPIQTAQGDMREGDLVGLDSLETHISQIREVAERERDDEIRKIRTDYQQIVAAKDAEIKRHKESTDQDWRRKMNDQNELHELRGWMEDIQEKAAEIARRQGLEIPDPGKLTGIDILRMLSGYQHFYERDQKIQVEAGSAITATFGDRPDPLPEDLASHYIRESVILIRAAESISWDNFQPDDEVVFSELRGQLEKAQRDIDATTIERDAYGNQLKELKYPPARSRFQSSSDFGFVEHRFQLYARLLSLIDEQTRWLRGAVPGVVLPTLKGGDYLGQLLNPIHVKDAEDFTNILTAGEIQRLVSLMSDLDNRITARVRLPFTGPSSVGKRRELHVRAMDVEAECLLQLVAEGRKRYPARALLLEQQPPPPPPPPVVEPAAAISLPPTPPTASTAPDVPTASTIHEDSQ